MDQTVMRFADDTARSSAIGTAVSEGMVSYLDSTDAVEVFDGSVWKSVGQDLSTGTSGFTALSAGTAGISYQPVSHNYIINGAFDVWQRGTSASITPGAGGRFAADRIDFFNNVAGSTVTVSQQTFTPGELEAIGFGDARFYHRTALSGYTSANFDINHQIEDVKTLAGQTVTLSFWAKAAATTSIALFAQQVFGSGGSSTATTNLSAQSVGTSWQRYTRTFTFASMSGKTIGTNSHVNLKWRIESNATLDIWGVQLEAGSVATPFKRHAPSLQGELAACQRYYFRNGGSGLFQQLSHWGVATSTTNTKVAIQPPVTMRILPSSVEFSTLFANDSANIGNSITALTIDGAVSGPSLVALNATTSGRTQHRPDRIIANNSLSAFIALTAEL
jgi:hypothetical protein